jgi:hypothetical protein
VAALQKTKVRQILNLTTPKGTSLKNAINMWKFNNQQINTPRLFGEATMKAEKRLYSAKQIFRMHTR